MHRLFRIEIKSVVIGTFVFFVLFLIATATINLLMKSASVTLSDGSLGRKLLGLIGMFPFLAAGFFVALKTHPSGVFNSSIVGFVAGVLVILFTRFYFGELPGAYSTTIGVIGGIGTSLLYCAFGGLLGSITMHYKQR